MIFAVATVELWTIIDVEMPIEAPVGACAGARVVPLHVEVDKDVTTLVTSFPAASLPIEVDNDVIVVVDVMFLDATGVEELDDLVVPDCTGLTDFVHSVHTVAVEVDKAVIV